MRRNRASAQAHRSRQKSNHGTKASLPPKTGDWNNYWSHDYERRKDGSLRKRNI